MAGSRTEALRLVRNLIGYIALPPGSAPLSGPVPAVFGPSGQPTASIPQQAVAYGLWSSPASMDATAGFAQAHPPAGTRFAGPNAAGMPKTWPEEVNDELTALPPGIQGGELRLLIAPHGGGSVTRAVVWDRWFPPRSAAESVPAGMRAVTVSAQDLIPLRRSRTRTFTCPAVVRELADMLNGMNAAPAIPPGRSCIAPMGTYQVAFAPSPGARPAFFANAANGGCGGAGIVAHGTAQPPLDDPHNSLVQTANRLLGVAPA